MNQGKLLIIIYQLLILKQSNSLLLKPNEQQVKVLQSTVMELLEFQNLPKPVNHARPQSKGSYAVSKYMRNLFDKYRSDGGKLVDGNVVRSVSPVNGTWSGQNVLLFRLKPLKSSEEFLHAELHFNLRNQRRHSGPDARWRVKAFGQYSHGQQQELRPQSELQDHRDWLSFDASKLVQLASRKKNNGTTISIKFLYDDMEMRPDNLIKHNTPFMLIHINEHSLFDKDKLQLALEGKDSAMDDWLPMLSKPRKRRMSGYYAYSAKARVENHALGGSNQDETETELKKFRDLGPRILQDRKQMRRKQQTRKQRNHNGSNSSNAVDPMMGFGKPMKITKVMARQKAQTDDADFTVVLLPGQGQTMQKCGIQKLNVKFRDIGWGHWIIAPPSFEAHYCNGNCPFPLSKEVNPSNHAIVQSIIHRLGLHPYVPDVCCAPEKMDSLTLLYYDESENVVLKNYPRMTVRSCACL